MKNNNAIIYYNDNGLNIYYNNKCYLFSNILSNFILNFSNQIFASSMNNIYLPKKIFKLDANILNIDTINLKFPFERGFIYQDFSLYEYPKYYSPTFDYENTENKYYLGVYSIANKTINNLNFTIPKGDDIFQQSIECSDGTYRNSILFIADMQGNILWTWDLYEYLKNNNLSLLEHPIIQTASRLGKNYLNLNENDIVISISKRNQILIINPLNNNIDLKITQQKGPKGMETQYYTLIEKQDFYEIIENKYGELAIFIDARDGLPNNPVLEFDGKQTALLKRDPHLAVRLDDIHEETVAPLAESEFVMIVELKGKMVERVYAVPVENVEEIVFEGNQTRADEIVKAKSRDELLETFGAVKIWSNGSTVK